MKNVPRVIRYLVWVVITFFPLLPSSPLLPAWASAATVVERVVAVVNGEPILWSEFEAQRIILSRQGQSPEPNKVLDMLIEDAVLKSEAFRLEEEKKLEASHGEIEFEMKMYRDRYPTEETFVEDLGKTGLTVEKFKERLRKELLVRKLIQQEVQSKIAVTEKDIDGYYESNKNKFGEVDLLRIRLLRLKSEEEVKKVQVEMKTGKTFLEVLKKYGDEETKAREGVMDNVRLADWKEHLRSAIEPLRVGEVSPPILDDGVWYIFKVEDRVPGRQLTLVDAMTVNGQSMNVIEVIRRTLQSKFAMERYDAWLKTLRASTSIERKPLP